MFDAIDSGRLWDETGKSINIWTPEGLDYLGNAIEGNGDSCNRMYYGSYEMLARYIIGSDIGSRLKNNMVPSSLQMFSTTLRDPIWWRLNKKLVNFYER